MIKTFDDFAAAQAARDADPDTPHSISGTYVGDKPKYFLMPLSATDEEVRDAAFEVREGRPPSQYEHMILQLAMAGAA